MSVLYNSLTRQHEPFSPLTPGSVRIYACGVTVYDDAHLGHIRAAFTFDLFRRHFQSQGFQVQYIRNITDVDDKIIDKAKKEGATAQAISERYAESYRKDLESIGIAPPDKEPKATEHIPQMIALIQRLIAGGHAYAAGGDVYFRVRSFPDYGKLSHQSVDELRAGVRIAAGEQKEDPLDFALWKSSKPGEPQWDSPWGKGRPGWHIECSAMSMNYLGETFDIHGGGLDLIFPHHENEIAQSEAATGKPFAKWWVHCGLVTVNSQKMAKSIGNVVKPAEILARHSNPDVLKLLLLMTHYNSPLDFTWEKLDEAAHAYERFTTIADQVDGMIEQHGRVNKDSAELRFRQEISEAAAEFSRSMASNLNTPAAVASLFKLVDIAYVAKSNAQYALAADAVEKMKELGRLLGLFQRFGHQTIPAEIKQMAQQRDAARKAKDFKESDRLRNEIQKLGYVVEDTTGGTICRPK